MSNIIQNITHRIYFFRGVPVLLDRDLAEWFEVKPIRLREQVKRNIKRFPIHFRFVLSEQEVDVLVSQNAIPSRKVLGGSLPQVFTEFGVLQLANVLRSEKATEMSILIIEAFVAMRQHATNYEALAAAIKKLENSTNHRFAEVGQVLDALLEQKQLQENQKQRKRIGYRQ
ncbi:MAG: ORF6N domain-containing protein [Flavobacteriaceae bacterium]|jgi:hypothetical protein|nr:ORF6N domain-containing protein [Flavobacteriaceae bacterium]MDG2290130.1 ORF6N domain-containing protein [Flavobacteriaceae bacterium]